jgi:hypothetical protein
MEASLEHYYPLNWKDIATKIAARIGQFIAVGFIFLGFYSNPFLIFIGLFVIVAAQMETQHAASKFILKGFKVRDILMKQYQSDVLKHITLLLDSHLRYLW